MDDADGAISSTKEKPLPCSLGQKNKFTFHSFILDQSRLDEVFGDRPLSFLSLYLPPFFSLFCQT